MNIENFKCLVNKQTIIEASAIGFITFILGIIFIKISEKKEDKVKNKQNFRIYISLFLTGFLLHFIIEILGINKWYCDKKCMVGIKNISKI
jgi:uncharacterized membrane protein